MFNLVELMADEQRESPCVHGNIVEHHACYCHAPVEETPRKCHIWRSHAEDITFWRHSKELDPDLGCPYFEQNRSYSARENK